MDMLNALGGGERGDQNDERVGDEKRSEIKSGKRNRLTISLSDRSVTAFREIRELTDADSDSEVFRNALRLYLGLLRAHEDGKTILIRDEKRNGAVYPVEFFLPVK
jgi:Ribbon-helix-helix protein, copG family